MPTILRQMSNDLYTSPLGVVHFYPLKDPNVAGVYDVGHRLGDCDDFTLEIEQTKRERKSKEHNVLTTVLEQVSEIKANISLTVMQYSEIVRAASIMGKMGTFSQTEETGVVLELGDVGPGIYDLGSFATTNAVVTENGADIAVFGKDWLIDAASGQIQILREMVDCTVTYDVAAITEAFMSGIASSSGLVGKITFRPTNDDGVKSMFVFRNVQLSPGGSRSLIAAGTDFEGIKLSGIATPLSGVGDIQAGTEIGFEMDLPDI